MFCMNCGQKISDDAKVCEFCGTPVEGEDEEVVEATSADETPSQEIPIEKVSAEEVSADEIPASQPVTDNNEPIDSTASVESSEPVFSSEPVYNNGPVYNNEPVNNQEPENNVPPAGSGNVVDPGAKPKKGIGVILGIVAGILVIGVVGGVLFKFVGGMTSGSKDEDPEYPGVYYLQDNELYFSKYTKSNPKRIDEDIMDRWSDDYDYGGYSSQFKLSDDGKYIFYGVEGDSDSGYTDFDLCYISTGLKGESKKVAENVVEYKLLDGNKVIFQDDDMSLYISNLKDKTKIAKNVSSFYVDESEKYVLWLDQDGDLSYQGLDLKKDKEKIDKDVFDVKLYSEKLRTIVYSKLQDNLYDVYLVKDLGDKEKIVGNVDGFNAFLVNDKVNIYYAKGKGDSSFSLLEFVEDDYPEDANIKEPDIKDYTTYTTVNGFFGPTTREEVDDKYYDEYAKYQEKLQRDYLRDNLRSYTMNLNETTIYFYQEGKQEEKVDSGIIEVGNYIKPEDDTPVVLYHYLDVDNAEKIKLSKIAEGEISTGEIQDRISDTMIQRIAKGTKFSDIAIPEMYLGSTYLYSSDKKQLISLAYDLDDVDKSESEKTGELYVISVADKNLGEFQKMDSDVDKVMYVKDGDIYYLSDMDYSSNEGDLYCNGEKIGSDVYFRTVLQKKDAGFLYYTDYDSNDAEGTLNLYKNGKSVKVCEDVHSCYAYTEKFIATLSDYSKKNHMGDLKIFNGKENVKIASDVNAIIY